LSGIAERYRVSLSALRRANAIRDDDYVRAGIRLRIPG
jgi:LysM repeat protein